MRFFAQSSVCAICQICFDTLLHSLYLSRLGIGIEPLVFDFPALRPLVQTKVCLPLVTLRGPVALLFSSFFFYPTPKLVQPKKDKQSTSIRISFTRSAMPEIRRGSSVHASSNPTSPLAASTSSQLPPIPPASISQSQSNDDAVLHQAAETTSATDLRSASIDHAGDRPPRRSITLAAVVKPRRHSSDLHRASSLLAEHATRTTSPSAATDAPPRRSLSYAHRPEATAYYDSRAATRAEYQRRAKTLEEYYDDNPSLLPQLPFTWHHGWRRWRLFFFAFLVFVDACAIPIALYYGMWYAGNVEGYIIFAVVTTIWGGPTYLEFAIRTLRLIKKERFYRPLGTNSRWCFDVTTWTSVITITAVTALFVVGSVPHIVWLRVLCMPAPAILYSIGGVMALILLYQQMGWKAPFRLSSTPKGGKVC